MGSYLLFCQFDLWVNPVNYKAKVAPESLLKKLEIYVTSFKLALLSCHPPSRPAVRIRIIPSLCVGCAFQEPFPDFTLRCSHWSKLTQMRDDCTLFSFLLLLTSWGNCLWKMWSRSAFVLATKYRKRGWNCWGVMASSVQGSHSESCL